MTKPVFVEWADVPGVGPRRMRCGDFEYLMSSVGQSYGRKSVVIERVTGEWPKQIITLADGDDPDGPPRHFGGEVYDLGPDKKRVEIYTD